MQYALDLLNDPIVEANAINVLDQWTGLHKRLVGRRRPEDLRVLYLCGPEPLNDLEVLLKEGVDPHNIWAVESNPQDFQRALDELLHSRTPIKIYPGDLAGFLELNSEVFDIIYFDGCSPFGAGKPNTLGTLLKLFQSQRLAPLGALITTFAELGTDQVPSYADVLSAYFRYRYDDVPSEMKVDPAVAEHDDGDLRAAIRQNHEPYYSDFITRFIADVARSLVPNCRAFAFTGFERAYLASKQDRKDALATAVRIPAASPTMSIRDLVIGLGDFELNPGGYPLLSFMRTVERRSKKTPFWTQLAQMRLGRRSLLEGAQYAALLDNCIEGHWKAMGGVLLDAIRLGWFDRNMGLSCDVPLPNLMVNSFLGIHGTPAFPNPIVSDRFRYRAKRTTMYTDLMILDRCRSYFDWFPTAHVAAARFSSVGFQLVARCILDRIGWADWHARSHPFRGAAMAGMNSTPHAKPVTFPPRTEVGP